MVLKRGTFKVVRTSPSGIVIVSRMFRSLEAAEIYGKRFDRFLVFRLERSHFGRDFKWRLVHTGDWKFYREAVSQSDDGLVRFILGA